MKRLKYLFGATLFLLALPAWRLLDWAAVTLPFPVVIMACQTLWSAVFLFFPVTLFRPDIKKWMLFLLILTFASLSWISGPVTSQATLEPTLTHCGRTSYAGFFYPVRQVLSPVHQDDLEIRNQMCWVVKLIKLVPAQILPEDLAHQLNIMKFKLLKPQLKFRATLPWITFLLGNYLASTELKNSPLLIQNLGFWSELYSEEISARNYAWYEWPHSAFVKFEYGFIEENWENIKLEIGK